MPPKTRIIIGWVLSCLLAAFMLFSASGKLIPNEHTPQIIATLGLTPELLRTIGIIEVLSALLFLIPRTGVLGAMLLTAYLGGAIATHLEHPQAGPPTAPIIVESVLWIAAVLRFPELLSRLMGSAGK